MARNQVSVEIVPFEHEGDTYQLRKGLTWGDLCDLVDEALDVTIEGDIRRVRAGATQLMQLLAGIKSWSGPGWLEKDGTTTPVNLAAVRALPPSLARTLLAQIREVNPNIAADAQPSASEAKSPASAGPSTSASAADA